MREWSASGPFGEPGTVPEADRLAALGYVKCGTMSEKGQHEMIRAL